MSLSVTHSIALAVSIVLAGCSAGLFAAPSAPLPQTTPRADDGVDKSAGWWFPSQRAPRGIVRTTAMESFPRTAPTRASWARPELGPTHLLVESLAGLAAKAVNDGTSDELVWISHRNADQSLWLELASKRLNAEDRGRLEPWALAERMVKQGVVKGYILYRYDAAPVDAHARRRRPDVSANVATSLAGPLRAMIVEEKQEEQAKALGLTCVFDARGVTQQQLYDEHRDRFSTGMLMLQDPKIPHCRDFAIAHDVAVLYGSGEPVVSALSRLEPGSPILGWNVGDEGANTEAFSRHAHFNTATDWAMNLTVTSAGAREAKLGKLPAFDASKVDWKREGRHVAFVMSDGDNLQWATTTFFRERTGAFWPAKEHGKVDMTWTMCLAHLRQVAPDAFAYLLDTLPEKSEVVEFGGGYYNPDTFGVLRPNREELLAAHARATWINMQATGADILCLIAKDLDSDESKQAYEIYAREMPGLTGIIVMDYFPYHGGHGKVMWAKAPDGTEIPIMAARLELRTDFSRDGTGDAAEIAKKIGTPMYGEANVPELQWVVEHAWSHFNADGTRPTERHADEDEQAQLTLSRGVAPLVRTVERLPPDTHAVGMREVLWRLRMERDPDRARRLLNLPAE